MQFYLFLSDPTCVNCLNDQEVWFSPLKVVSQIEQENFSEIEYELIKATTDNSELTLDGHTQAACQIDQPPNLITVDNLPQVLNAPNNIQ